MAVIHIFNIHDSYQAILQAVQMFSTLGMTQIDDLVNNIFSVFDRFLQIVDDQNYFNLDPWSLAIELEYKVMVIRIE